MKKRLGAVASSPFAGHLDHRAAHRRALVALEVDRNLLAREVVLQVARLGLGRGHLHVHHLHDHIDGTVVAVDEERAVDRGRHVVDGVGARPGERGLALDDRQPVLEQIDADDLALDRRVGRDRGRRG
jgi:hypothetical protein